MIIDNPEQMSANGSPVGCCRSSFFFVSSTVVGHSKNDVGQHHRLGEVVVTGGQRVVMTALGSDLARKEWNVLERQGERLLDTDMRSMRRRRVLSGSVGRAESSPSGGNPHVQPPGQSPVSWSSWISAQESTMPRAASVSVSNSLDLEMLGSSFGLGGRYVSRPGTRTEL